MPIFNNLAKYAKSGSTIDIRYSRNGGNLCVDFSTTSVGVPFSEKERIFEKNFSGSYSTELKKNGRGLGMYHAQSLLNFSRVKLEFIPGEIASDKYANNIVRLIFHP
jgi:K+-sensing histidine kinase KdpD